MTPRPPEHQQLNNTALPWSVYEGRSQKAIGRLITTPPSPFPHPKMWTSAPCCSLCCFKRLCSKRIRELRPRVTNPGPNNRACRHAAHMLAGPPRVHSCPGVPQSHHQCNLLLQREAAVCSASDRLYISCILLYNYMYLSLQQESLCRYYYNRSNQHSALVLLLPSSLNRCFQRWMNTAMLCVHLGF